MKKEKGVVLILALWVLAIATLLTVSLARQSGVSLNLVGEEIRQLQYEEWLKAGVQRAAYEILYQAPFREQEMLYQQIRYHLTEEEGRININSVPKGLLALLPGINAVTAEVIVHWRETVHSFRSPAELLLIEGIEPDVWDQLAPLVTVHGMGQIAVNSASLEVLNRLVQWSLSQLPNQEQLRSELVEVLAKKFLAYRAGADGELDSVDDRRFLRRDKIEEELQNTGLDLTEQEIGIVNQMELYLTTEASLWRVEVQTQDQRSGWTRSAEVVFKIQESSKIQYLSWLERGLQL